MNNNKKEQKSSILVDILGSIKALIDELTSKPAVAKKINDIKDEVREVHENLDSIHSELDGLQNKVDEIVKQANNDKEVVLETLKRLQRLESVIIERLDSLEKSLKPADHEQVSKLKAALKQLKAIILILVGATGGALFDAGVQNEIYPTLKRALKTLLNNIDSYLKNQEIQPTPTPSQVPQPSPIPEVPTQQKTPKAPPSEQPFKDRKNYHQTDIQDNSRYALENFDEAIQFTPRNAKAYLARATFHLRKMQAEYIKDKPNSKIIASEFGLVNQDTEMAISLDSNFAEAYYVRGETTLWIFENYNLLIATGTGITRDNFRKVIELSNDPELRKNAQDEIDKFDLLFNQRTSSIR